MARPPTASDDELVWPPREADLAEVQVVDLEQSGASVVGATGRDRSEGQVEHPERQVAEPVAASPTIDDWLAAFSADTQDPEPASAANVGAAPDPQSEGERVGTGEPTAPHPTDQRSHTLLETAGRRIRVYRLRIRTRRLFAASVLAAGLVLAGYLFSPWVLSRLGAPRQTAPGIADTPTVAGRQTRPAGRDERAALDVGAASDAIVDRAPDATTGTSLPPPESPLAEEAEVVAAPPVTDRTDVDTPAPPVADRGMSPVTLARTDSAATTHVPTTSLEVPSPPPVIDDRERIKDLVRRYESAYDQRDVGAVVGLWAEVDQGALTRAFQGLSEQDLVLGECDVSIGGAAATARCPGSLRYVPRVGRPLPRVEELSWTFFLQRDASEWRIRAVSAGR